MPRGRPRNVGYRSTRVRKTKPLHPVLEQLREHRITKGVTQGDLAFNAGYDAVVVHRLEYGANLPRMKTFLDLCDTLGLEIVLVDKEKINAH